MGVGAGAPASPYDDVDERSRAAVHRWVPLSSMLAGLLLAILVLPSALSVPRTAPTATLELAPVLAPTADGPGAPPTGLAVGGPSGLPGGGPGTGLGGAPPASPPPTRLPGGGREMSTFRCVRHADGVVRQTEDPLSPPCVPFFEGDNFGTTYQGVTDDEIRVVLYYDGGFSIRNTSRGLETCPATRLYDLFRDAERSDDCIYVRQGRIWQQYLNERYQTYGRAVHLYLYFGTRTSAASAETRRADAAEVFRSTQPFATLDLSQFTGGGDAYVDSMARRGVLNLGQFAGQRASFFAEFPRLVWGYQPSQEIVVADYTSVLCNHYVGLPVQHSGSFDGQPRRFGLVWTTDPAYAARRSLKDAVVEDVEACGGHVAAEGTHPAAGSTVDTQTSSRYATEVMARFQQLGITTIIWPGGIETRYSKAASDLRYFPEWVLLGDGDLDSEAAQQGDGAGGQDPDVWDHAVVVSANPLIPDDPFDRVCIQAQRSVAPDTPIEDAQFGCTMYDTLRQLATGIQVAGPRLGPTSVDRGFHAIPPIASRSLEIPACYYLPGDYTCIKDFVLGEWDPDARGPSDATPGCYRIVGARRRILADTERGQPLVGYDPERDPCLGYGSTARSNLNPPDPTDL